MSLLSVEAANTSNNLVEEVDHELERVIPLISRGFRFRRLVLSFSVTLGETCPVGCSVSSPGTSTSMCFFVNELECYAGLIYFVAFWSLSFICNICFIVLNIFNNAGSST